MKLVTRFCFGAFVLCFLLRFSPVAALAQQVKVMQWNVQGNLGTATAQAGTGAAAIARILNYLQPDVLLINEVADGNEATNTASLTQWAGANLPYLASGSFYVAVSTEYSDYQRNAAISRYPVLNPITYPDVSSGLRGMYSFDLQLAGSNRLHIFHVHLKCCSDGTSCQTKQNEAQLFTNNIATWAATNSTPYIFAGDLNEDEANPECPGFPTISTLRDGANLGEFKPTTLSGEYRTWSTAATPSIRFDYVLAATNRISPESGFVFSTMDWAAHGLYTNASPQNLANDARTASDHFGVVAIFNFGEQLSVSPATGFSFAGPPGGSFDPGSQTYTLSNPGNATLNWTATNTANWLSLSQTSGTLPPGASTNLIVSINPNANNLGAGSYADTIWITNTTDGRGSTTRDVNLNVGTFGFFDDFSTFGAGNLVGQQSWLQLPGSATLPLQVGGGQVVIPFGQSADNQDAYKNFTVTSGTVFYGLLLAITNAPVSSNPSYFAALYTGNNASGFANYRLTANDNGGGTCVLGLRITGQTGNPYTFGTGGLSYGSQHRVIVEADSGGGVMKLFVDPTSANLAAQIFYASNYIGSGTPPTQVGSFVISQFASGTAPNVGVAVAKVVVSDNFATVYNDLTPALTPFQAWQLEYFGSTNSPSADPGADPDGDGLNNQAEFFAGTNPTNNASTLRILGVTRENNDLRVTWSTAGGRTNVLQAAPALNATFTNVSPNLILAGGDVVTNYLDAGAVTGSTPRYYRVYLVP